MSRKERASERESAREKRVHESERERERSLMKVKKLRERLFFPFLFSIFIPPQEITSKRRRSFRIREQKISQVKQASGEELTGKIIEKSRQR